MKNVTVRRESDGVEFTIQIDEDQDVPAGYETVETKAKTPANKQATPANKSGRKR